MAYSGPELCKLTASQAVDLLKKGEVSPTELLAASQARTAEVEPAINAMPTTCFERAETFAKKLAKDQSDPAWLGGLPVGIKDLNPVAGVRTTFGTKGFADFVPPQSDRCVERIESHGGLVVGKTNTPELGAGANTFNDVLGVTRNPWDTSKNAGGSSGGAAAGLATGEVWLSHGSDLAGSLRTPAAYCGVVGLRPSPGRVPEGVGETGHFGTEGLSGPMARNVRDCALFLDVMSGFDPSGPISHPAPDMPFAHAVDAADEKVRIAYSPDWNGFSFTSKQMDDHLRGALQKVENAGGFVDEGCPELPELDKTYRVLRAMLWAAGPGRMPDHVQQHFKRTMRENIQYGKDLKIDDVYDAYENRTILFRNMVTFLDDFDVLACPVVGLMPGPVEEEYPTHIDGKPLGDYIEWLKYSYLSTATRLPSISVPVGLTQEGMPVGIQLIGKPRGEARMLQVARAIEVANGGPLGPIDPNVTHQ